MGVCFIISTAAPEEQFKAPWIWVDFVSFEWKQASLSPPFAHQAVSQS